MVRIEDIRKGFAGLVGWRQPYNPAFEIDGDLAESGSGLYFQDAHPMLTLENMASVMPDTWDCQYPEWEAAAVYAEGDKVRHGGAVWSALQGNTGQDPEDGGQYWKRYNTLSDFLRRLTDGGITAVAQTFLQMKQLTNETRDLLERRTFFDGAGRIRETEQNRHRIVGYEIVPIRAMGVTTKIEKAGLQMAGGTGKVKLYLFHSSQPEPVKDGQNVVQRRIICDGFAEKLLRLGAEVVENEVVVRDDLGLPRRAAARKIDSGLVFGKRSRLQVRRAPVF